MFLFLSRPRYYLFKHSTNFRPQKKKKYPFVFLENTRCTVFHPFQGEKNFYKEIRSPPPPPAPLLPPKKKSYQQKRRLNYFTKKYKGNCLLLLTKLWSGSSSLSSSTMGGSGLEILFVSAILLPSLLLRALSGPKRTDMHFRTN